MINYFQGWLGLCKFFSDSGSSKVFNADHFYFCIMLNTAFLVIHEINLTAPQRWLRKLIQCNIVKSISPKHLKDRVDFLLQMVSSALWISGYCEIL